MALDDNELEHSEAIKEECYRVAHQLLAEIKLHTPVGKTGRLKAGYRVNRTPDGAEIVAGVDYWSHVEYGTLPHRIPNAFGRNREVLHPGASAQPHVRPAIEAVRRLNGV